jgi:hypothetical protein
MQALSALRVLPLQQHQQHHPTTSPPQLRYVTFEGSLNGSLPLFDASIAQGYKGDIQSFQANLTNVARYYVNAVTQRNVLTFVQLQQLQEQQPKSGDFLLGSSSGGTSFNVGGTINSFDTNNQEANVDEGDLVKSDGTTGTKPTIYTSTCMWKTTLYSYSHLFLSCLLSVCSV